MSTRVVERVDDWDERSFGDGYRGLQELAAGEFSGVVRAGGAELYMTRGTVVGIPTGSMSAVEGATGTAYEAPDGALPLLAVMQESADDARAQYYTEDTPISEVDVTLQDGGFTGFLELSENVLSGDYYLVYHGGTSSSLAYVGNSSRLQTDSDAYDLLDDEVGIYKVYQVDVEPIEIPEPSGGPSSGTEDDGTTSGEDPTDAPAATTDAGAAVETDPEPSPVDDPAESPGEDATDAGEPAASTVETGDVRDESDSAHDESDSGHEVSEPVHGEAEASGTDDTVTTPEDTASDAGTESTPSSSVDADDPDASTTATSSTRSTDGVEGSTGTEDSDEPVESEGTTATEPAESPPTEPREGEGSGTTVETTETTTSAASRTDQPVTDSGTDLSAGESARSTVDSTPGDERSTTADRHDAGSSRRNSATGTDRSGAAGASQLETRSIPSLDPERSHAAEGSNGARGDAPGRSPAQSGGESRTQNPGSGAEQAQTEPARDTREPQGEPTDRRTDAREQVQSAEETASTDATADPERVETLEADIDEKRSEIERLESKLETVAGERDEFEADLESTRQRLDDVRTERDQLRGEVERLESEIERLEAEYDLAVDAERRLSPAEALEGTDLFVRYGSKGDATLEKAHDTSVRREDVNANMRLEKHTQFDTENVAVGGKDYHEFLEGTVEYRFIEWVVRDLLFEIRNTGHGGVLKDLYNALPQLDRAEIKGVVSVTLTEDGQETRTEETFDVVLRDRMGNPLLVANLNDSRQAATKSMMESLITSAERVGQSNDALAGAFLVTRSFFEPEALETASDATQGGILSRDKRKSYVNLARKRGYHLCLVEARNENFHLAVPEL